MLRDSVFRTALSRGETTKHTGYDYKGKILKNTMSGRMFTSNKTMYDFLAKLDSTIYETFEQIKSIRGFYSIARGINDRKFN